LIVGFSGERRSVMPRARKYPVELLERATRLVFESGRPIAHVAADLG
jgi:transposase-like protein